MIEISGLTRSFRGVTALDDVNVSCADGEITGIIGPAGSGKTTLLRIASGKDRPSRGTVKIDSRETSKMKHRERDRIMSYFSGAIPLNPEDTVENFIILSRACLRGPLSPLTEIDRETADAYIADLGLESVRGRKLEELCRNDLTLSLLAHAFTREAGTILLDEPGRFLDLNSLRLLHRTLAKISARARTAVLFCASDINFAAQISDRIIVMHGGKIVEEGKPSIITAELIRRYFGVDAVLSKNIFNGRPEVHFFPHS